MAHLLSWPKRRTLTTEDGVTLVAAIAPGRLEVRLPGGGRHVITNPDDLRAFAMQVYAAAIDRDQGVQHAAAKASADRRLRRIHAGQPPGLRHHPFVDQPEPPAHMEVPA